MPTPDALEATADGYRNGRTTPNLSTATEPDPPPLAVELPAIIEEWRAFEHYMPTWTETDRFWDAIRRAEDLATRLDGQE